MKCYYGDGADAVGICSGCGRAICRDHVAEVGDRIACKGRHEAKVAELDRSAGLMRLSSKFAAYLLIAAGAALTIWGLERVPDLGLDSIDWPFLLIGLGLFVFGWIWIWLDRRPDEMTAAKET